MITGAELLVRMLRAYQVEVIFGVPGDTNVPLYAALQQSEDCLRHVMARDERSAGFMADAYARLSRRPGIVEVPSGAGALYALPAIAEAHQSSIPLLLITSDTPIALEGRGVITELDCAKLFETVTKASILVKSPTKIPEIIRRAFRVMTSGRPGAVHLAIPEDVLAQGVEDDRLSCHAEIGLSELSVVAWHRQCGAAGAPARPPRGGQAPALCLWRRCECFGCGSARDEDCRIIVDTRGDDHHRSIVDPRLSCAFNRGDRR